MFFNPDNPAYAIGIAIASTLYLLLLTSVLMNTKAQGHPRAKTEPPAKKSAATTGTVPVGAQKQNGAFARLSRLPRRRLA